MKKIVMHYTNILSDNQDGAALILRLLSDFFDMPLGMGYSLVYYSRWKFIMKWYPKLDRITIQGQQLL